MLSLPKKAMPEAKTIGYDVDDVIAAFGLRTDSDCPLLQQWTAAHYELDMVESAIIDQIHADMREAGDYLNEEELKIRFVGGIFLVAKVDVKHRLRVFYERPLAAEINGYRLAVICDCLVASPYGKNSPQKPYFFLQEFKKGKGEKNDPEGQMLTAMLIAQQRNEDGQPIYGGFLVGTDWRFAMLIGQEYCVSDKFDATQRDEIEQIVCIVRRLKDLVLAD